MRFQESQTPENRGEICSKEGLPSVEEDLIREYLNKIKSIEPGGMHRGVLRGWSVSLQNHSQYFLKGHRKC